jgi:hypothetical protein
VSDDGQSTGFVYRIQCFLQFRAILRHMIGPSRSQPFFESVRNIPGQPLGDEPPGKMHATGDIPAGDGIQHFNTDIPVVFPHQTDHFLISRHSPPANFTEEILQRAIFESIHAQTQEMKFSRLKLHFRFHAGYESDSGVICRSHGLGNSGQRVMVGQGQSRDAGFSRQSD